MRRVPTGLRTARELAYSRFAAPGTYDYSIRIINLDGTGDTEVTGSKWPLEAAWSPDGRYLVVAMYQLGMSVIELATRRGTGIPYPPEDGMAHIGNPDWQAIPAPRRSDYKNAAAFCNAERDFFGVEWFRQRYKNYGGCVSSNR